MKGCLAVVGGVVILLFVIGACAMSLAPTGTGSKNPFSASGVGGRADNSNADCNNAIDHSNQAFKDFNAGDYAGGYKNANRAVSLAENCPDGGARDSTLGFALSARAFNEHHLSQGDARTDLNQAEQLLSSCQSDVGYYGTHEAAVCETQEQNDIRTQTNWEMENY